MKHIFENDQTPSTMPTAAKEKSYLLPLLTTVLLVAGFAISWQIQLRRERAFQRDRMAAEVNRLSTEIDATLKETSRALERYTSRLEYLGTQDKKYLELDTKAYLEQLPILKSLGLIDKNYRLVWSYPLADDREMPGFDESQVPLRLQALQTAQNTHQSTLSSALKFASGDTEFLLTVALFPKGKMAGFVFGTIDASRLFRSHISAEDFKVTVRENNQIIFNSNSTKDLATEFTQSHSLNLKNTAWEIELTPTEQYMNGERSSVPEIILSFGILASLLLGGLLLVVVRSRRDALANAENVNMLLDWKRAIINGSGYAIISTDVDGIIRTFNNAATEMLGYDASEVIGKATPKLFHVDEEARQRAEKLSHELGFKIQPGFEAIVARAKATKRADEDEWTYVRKDGSRFPAQLSVSVLYDKKGEIAGYLGVMLDLTEKKKAQAQLTVTSERLSRVVDATAEGIWEREYVPGGGVIFIDNQAKHIFGFSADEEPTYTDIVNAVLPEDRALISQALEVHVNQNTPGFEIEFRMPLRTDPSRYRWVRSCGKVLRGEKPLLVSTIRDVTVEMEKREHLKSALQEAEAATRAKSEFLATMSHEIRTPLNGVIGVTGLLLDTKLDEVQLKYAETVRSSAEILLNLINDILDFSKIEARKLDLEKINFDIEQIVKNLIPILELPAQKKGLALSYNVSPNLPTKFYQGDPNRLMQIITNLVSNAIKFTASGQVTIAITQDSCNLRQIDQIGPVTLRIEVTDTGIGMPEDTLRKLFEPFSQADASMSRRFGGTGLGLSICKHLVDMMNGQIGVLSKEGSGSTFWFTIVLPRAAAPDLSAHPSLKPPRFNANAAKLRILLAEDQPVNQMIAVKVLEKHGFRVDAVANGLEAVEAAKSIPYDVILMDCQMPELDGYQATKRIRADANANVAQLPIIAMTANAMAGDREKCLAAGMNSYVSKPIRPDDLLAAIYGVTEGLKVAHSR